MAITVLLSFTACNAQIKNAKTESVKIYGNCGMCETTIEKAGNKKKIAKVDWNKDTKMATITYDAKKTNQDEILKRIALSGYDSDKFLAPDDIYSKLPGCCQYDRVKKVVAKIETQKVETKVDDHSGHNHSTTTTTEKPVEVKQEVNQLKAVFDNYFAVKDALVKTDGNTSSAKAKELLTAINTVKMDKLTTEEHTVWMKVMKDLTANAEKIATSKDVAKQRETFALLSKNMYELAKVSKQETPVYYQHCPMANNGDGGDWLSSEKKIQNPYYGDEMMECGRVAEEIKAN